jgi:hypothetical protein
MQICVLLRSAAWLPKSGDTIVSAIKCLDYADLRRPAACRAPNTVPSMQQYSAESGRGPGESRSAT